MRTVRVVCCLGLGLIVVGLSPAASQARPVQRPHVLMTTYESPIFDGQHRLFYRTSVGSAHTLDTRTNRSRPVDLHGCQPMYAYHAALLVNCREHSYSDPT